MGPKPRGAPRRAGARLRRRPTGRAHRQGDRLAAELSRSCKRERIRGSTLTIPSLTRTLTLEKTGKDHLIVLYSTHKIDPGMIRQICAELSANPGEPLQTLRRRLEKDRIPAGDIAYRPNEMGFEVNTRGKGRIVPVFLEIEVNE